MKYNIFLFIAFVGVFIPITTQAGDFVNLVGIPGLGDDPLAGGLNDYINALYRLSISIAALLAVIKIVIAGAKYMLSDIVTHKEDAKKDIQGALIGLLIVIGAVIILNTINTDLTNLDLTVPTTTMEQGPTIQEFIAAQQQTNPAFALCNDPALGGCTIYSCETLMEDILSYAAVGCAIGGTAGGVSGGVAGSAVPVLGNIIGFISGAGLGCAGGAITGSLVGSYTDDSFCSAGCSLTGGVYDANSNMCSVPNNSELFSEAQLTLACAQQNNRGVGCCARIGGSWDGAICNTGTVVEIPGGSTGDPALDEEACNNIDEGLTHRWDPVGNTCNSYEQRIVTVDLNASYTSGGREVYLSNRSDRLGYVVVQFRDTGESQYVLCSAVTPAVANCN